MLRRLFRPKRTARALQLKDTLKQGYALETHMHTSEASKCAHSSGREMAQFYKKLGYSGIVVTDHFFNGNNAIPPHLPWEERVRLFCKGYEHAFDEGKKIGLDVFFGWEYGYYGTEFLTYGLDKEWLLEHPDVLEWGVEDYLSRVRADGALVVHAHPFREASYIKTLRLFPGSVDAVEVINSRNETKAQDIKAYQYALKHRLLMTSGSDSHDNLELPGGGMILNRRPRSDNDLIRMIRDAEVVKLIGSERIESGK